MAIPFVLAIRINSDVHSRTCETLPGADVTSGWINGLNGVNNDKSGLYFFNSLIGYSPNLFLHKRINFQTSPQDVQH